MKKFFLFMFILMVAFSACIVFAEDSNDPKNIKNWIPFFTEGTTTLYYEPISADDPTAKTTNYTDAIGYEYFYVKADKAENEFESFRQGLINEGKKEFKNKKIKYIVFLYRMDCKNDTIEWDQLLLYSDQNQLIVGYSMLKGDKPRPFKGSKFEKIPFNQEWIIQAAQERDKADQWNRRLGPKLVKECNKLLYHNLITENPYDVGSKCYVIETFSAGEIQILSRTTALLMYNGAAVSSVIYADFGKSSAPVRGQWRSYVVKGDSNPYKYKSASGRLITAARVHVLKELKKEEN